MRRNKGLKVLNPPLPKNRDNLLYIMKERAVSDNSYRVAIPEWCPEDGIARMFAYELKVLGHEPVIFPYDSVLPKEIDVLLTFAPYNKVLRIWEQAAQLGSSPKPVVLHWNTEGLPDLNLPLSITKVIGRLRSKLGRMGYSKSTIERILYKLPIFPWLDQAMIRFRHYGDYKYAYRKGWLDLLFDSSTIYCDIRSKNGLPTQYAPWGSSSIYYQDLGLVRDIDVLWMGARGSWRRNRNLNFVVQALVDRGVKIHIADNVENPFIFNDERTEYLNRAKITLNLTRAWYDDNFSRYSMAAPNRSMIVSEPVLPHCPEFEAGKHYVSAKVKNLPEIIMYYIEHEDERQQIVENAFHLVTTKLRFGNSIQRMLDSVTQYKTSQGQK